LLKKLPIVDVNEANIISWIPTITMSAYLFIEVNIGMSFSFGGHSPLTL
jgi:hypothetical protein